MQLVKKIYFTILNFIILEGFFSLVHLACAVMVITGLIAPGLFGLTVSGAFLGIFNILSSAFGPGKSLRGYRKKDLAKKALKFEVGQVWYRYSVKERNNVFERVIDEYEILALKVPPSDRPKKNEDTYLCHRTYFLADGKENAFGYRYFWEESTLRFALIEDDYRLFDSNESLAELPVF